MATDGSKTDQPEGTQKLLESSVQDLVADDENEKVFKKVAESSDASINVQPSTLSKRAMKRQRRAERFKEMNKKRKTENTTLSGIEDAGFNKNHFNETSYYFDNGLRKVYPYYYVFATYAKGRWVGRTLKDVLENEFGFNHPSDVDKAFEAKKICVNHTVVKSNYVVRDCDYIAHQTHRHENPVTGDPIEIIENNEEVIVVNKPSSIPCHPCGRYRHNSLVFILGKEMGISNLRNIYRLDRLTSGVLIMGKTTESTKRLEDQVLKREVQKEYVCRVVGEFPSESLTVDQPLKPLSNKLRLQVVSPSGKPSQTTFQRISYNGSSSVVRCHPILNDVFYNSDAWGPNKGKDGHYEVSHETTCARIYHTHQATQWEGGDNPLYFEKLKEQSQESGDHKERDTPSTNLGATDTDPSNDDSTSTQTISSSTNTQTISRTASGSTESCDGSLGKEREEKNGPTPTCDLVCQNLDVVTDKTDNNVPTVAAVDDPTVTTQPAVESSPSSDSVTSSPSSDSVKTSLSSCVGKDGSRPGFNSSKWNVDTSCDMCRKTTIDPQPKDLIMFLHALKYKGPGWEYESKLPEWAQADWHRDDEFQVRSSVDEECQS